jgi:predicted glycoside hydrolase/deacetylase ChbG (UPF0249 family)
MRPHITLCADDFGYSRGTSQVIARLAHAGRINAVSCMAVMPGWDRDAKLLSRLEGHCQLGLHLTLTDERPLSAMLHYAPADTMPTAGALLRQAFFRDLPTSEIAVEVGRQFAAFSNRVGRSPDFVDCHQHVHHLPGIREIVLEETARRAPSAWVRSCSDTPAALLARAFPGKAIGSAWHSRGYTRLAARFGLATNHSFAGHYDFSPRFASVFPRFFDRASDHHVIMTHPGADDRAGDPIAKARVREAGFLESYP